MPNFNRERHSADYVKYGWKHEDDCICKGNFKMKTRPAPRDPSQPNREEIPVDKTIGDGQRIV